MILTIFGPRSYIRTHVIYEHKCLIRLCTLRANTPCIHKIYVNSTANVLLITISGNAHGRSGYLIGQVPQVGWCPSKSKSCHSSCPRIVTNDKSTETCRSIRNSLYRQSKGVQIRFRIRSINVPYKMSWIY